MNTPDNITHLAPFDIFVFGSNADGHHAGGAARFALDHFGAVWGQGEGLQGQSYAIPTMGERSDYNIAVARFLGFAALAPALTFYVTKLGTGIAGHPIAWAAEPFRGHPTNVIIPAEFQAALEGEQQ